MLELGAQFRTGRASLPEPFPLGAAIAPSILPEGEQIGNVWRITLQRRSVATERLVPTKHLSP